MTAETNPIHYTQKIKAQMHQLIDHVREDAGKATEPKAQALFETSAEVLTGLVKAFDDYEKKAKKRGELNIKTLAVTVAIACVLTSCQSPKARSPSGSYAAQSTRNNCCSLLHQLLDDQKNVSLLRFIKREQDDVKNLVKRIAAESGTGAKRLEELARHDPSINLGDIRLPPGEAATREAIAATRKKQLLGQTGDKFELSLLLTQAEALSYACHLAKVAAENEPQPESARALAGVGEDMKNLYQEVFVLLLSKTKSSATNQIRTQKK